MADYPFIDKFGRVFYRDATKAGRRDCTYFIIKRGNEVMGLKDTESGLFYFPNENDVELTATPSKSFSVLAYVFENHIPIKENQCYLIYEVEDADWNDTSFQWLKIDDLLVDYSTFDATQRSGLKNLVVRE